MKGDKENQIVVLQKALFLSPIPQNIIDAERASRDVEEAKATIIDKDISSAFNATDKVWGQKEEKKTKAPEAPQYEAFVATLWDMAFGKYENILSQKPNASMAGIITGISKSIIRFRDIEGVEMYYDSKTRQVYISKPLEDGSFNTRPIFQVCIEHTSIIPKTPVENTEEFSSDSKPELDLTKDISDLF